MAKKTWCELYDALFYDPVSKDEKNEIRDMTPEDLALMKKFIAGNFIPELEEHIKPHIEEWTPTEILHSIKDELGLPYF